MQTLETMNNADAYARLNRKGRREHMARIRKSKSINRKFNQTVHQKRERDRRAEGLAYRIAKHQGNMSVVKTFRKKHPKLKKQFKTEKVCSK